MSKHTRGFHRNDYALMRHAVFDEARDQIHPISAEDCQKSATRLYELVLSGKFIVFSSPERRALLTREVVERTLKGLGLEVICPDPLDWLGTRGPISRENIDKALREVDDVAFYLFISHQVPIETFVGTGRRAVENCDIVGQDLSI